MAFLELGEESSGNGRYEDAKFRMNQPRIYLTNRVEYLSERPAGEVFLPRHFDAITKETAGICETREERFAVWKRAVTILFLRDRIVVRLPDYGEPDIEKEVGPIFGIR